MTKTKSAEAHKGKKKGPDKYRDREDDQATVTKIVPPPSSGGPPPPSDSGDYDKRSIV